MTEALKDGGTVISQTSSDPSAFYSGQPTTASKYHPTDSTARADALLSLLRDSLIILKDQPQIVEPQIIDPSIAQGGPPYSDTIYISSLHDEPYTLLQPIPIRIEKVEEDDFLACFEEANISMSGETPDEAFQNLIADILEAFELFCTEETTLGPEPTRQLDVLRRYLQRQ